MESKFKGSSLEVALKNTNNVELFYKACVSAKEQQPKSLFWSEAVVLIEKRYKKTNK